MGHIFLAEDLELNRKAVLKFLPAQLPASLFLKSRFKREAQAAAALKHPNIITVYELGEYRNSFYIAMEYIEGKSLGEWIERKDTSARKIIDIGIQICRGLRKAHHAGIVHRDIKPANIMIGKDGWVKILDFGLAKMRDATRLTKKGMMIGTVSYMSPEQIRGKDLDQRSDIFSLGIVLYQFIAGQLPFRGFTEEEMIYSITHERPEPLARYKAGVTDGLQRIIDKALEKDLQMRFQYIDEFLSDLKREKKNYLQPWQSTVTVETLKSERAVRPVRLKINKHIRSKVRKVKRVTVVFLVIAILLLGLIALVNGKLAGPFLKLRAIAQNALKGNSFFNGALPQTDERLKLDSPLIAELNQISKTADLIRTLNKYSQLKLVSVGDKSDFKNADHCFVFVVDSKNVLGIFKIKDGMFHSLNSNKIFSTLSQRFSGKTSIWIQDQSLANPVVKVSFDGVKIFRHDRYSDIYGLHLKQGGWSKPFSDETDLLVLLDFQKPGNPQLHIRPWRADNINNELIRLDDFKVIK